jgi:hypothetical protein
MSSSIHTFKNSLHLSAARIDDTCQVYSPLATMAANQNVSTVSQKCIIDLVKAYKGGTTI